MQNGLKISFVNKDEFLALKGVKPDSLTKKPTEIDDTNLVGGYTLKEAVHKTSEDPTSLDPSYTTQAQACTAGFLMISGVDLHSHMMLHANGAKAKYEDASEIDPVIEAQEEFPKRLDEFFSQLDSMIRSGKLDGQTINIDTVLAGSTERFDGEHPKVGHVVKTSKDVRNMMIDLLNSRLKNIKALGEQHGVTVEVAQSHLLNQKVVVRSDLGKNAGEMSATHMHYDPENNTLSINAEYGIKGSDDLFNGEVLKSAVDKQDIHSHYAEIKIDTHHNSPELNSKIPPNLEVTIEGKGTLGQATGDKIVSILKSYNSSNSQTALGIAYKEGVITITGSSHLLKEEMMAMIDQQKYSGWFPKINNQNEHGDWQISLSPTPPPVVGLTQGQLKHSDDFLTSKDAPQGGVVIAKASNEITHVRTYGMGPCVGCTIYDPDTQTGLIAHIDSTEKAQDLVRIINILKHKGIDITALQATIHGGDQTEGSNDIFQKVLGIIKGNNINVRHASQGNSHEATSLQLDLRTGETSTFTRVNKNQTAKDQLILRSRMSIFSNQLSIEDLA